MTWLSFFFRIFQNILIKSKLNLNITSLLNFFSPILIAHQWGFSFINIFLRYVEVKHHKFYQRTLFNNFIFCEAFFASFWFHLFTLDRFPSEDKTEKNFVPFEVALLEEIARPGLKFFFENRRYFSKSVVPLIPPLICYGPLMCRYLNTLWEKSDNWWFFAKKRRYCCLYLRKRTPLSPDDVV